MRKGYLCNPSNDRFRTPISNLLTYLWMDHNLRNNDENIFRWFCYDVS